jgi:hypothetical protein
LHLSPSFTGQSKSFLYGHKEQPLVIIDIAINVAIFLNVISLILAS